MTEDDRAIGGGVSEIRASTKSQMISSSARKLELYFRRIGPASPAMVQIKDKLAKFKIAK